MKKYIKPEAVCCSADIESLLFNGTVVHNEEGNGIQRSKQFFGLEDNDEINEE